MRISTPSLLSVAALSLIVIAILFFTATTSVNAAKLEMEEEPVKIPTEKEVKKMKVKELKGFLADRGVECDTCAEKGDFVKKVVANLETPLLPSKRKLKPKGEFWEFWAALARSICDDAAKKKGSSSETSSEEVCNSIGGAFDSFFMQHGKRTAGKLKKKTANLLKTSVGEPYQGAGRRMIAKLVDSCLSSKKGSCSSQSKVQSALENNKVKNVDFSKWITNVGIENTNPMYEALKDKTLNADL